MAGTPPAESWCDDTRERVDDDIIAVRLLQLPQLTSATPRASSDGCLDLALHAAALSPVRHRVDPAGASRPHRFGDDEVFDRHVTLRAAGSVAFPVVPSAR
jgi:hypothetical protein